jgi:thioredoxin-related protein
MRNTLMIITLALFVCPAAAQKVVTAQPQVAETVQKTVVKWYNIEEAVKLNAKEPRKIFLDVYTDWCSWCKVMDRNTFSNEKIAEYLNTYYYPVKLNAEGKEPIKFGEKTYNFNPQYRSHDLAVSILQGQMSYPSIAYMDENLQMITVVPGYQRPEDIHPILVYFGQNHYKTVNWETFRTEWSTTKASN